MQTSRRRGPCGRNWARAGAWQVGTEGGDRGRCTWVPVGRGRRSDEQFLVRSPDEADASTGKGMEQREAERIQIGRGDLRVSESRTADREKIPGLVPACFYRIFASLLLSLDNRGLNKRTSFSTLGTSLAWEERGIAPGNEQIARRGIFAVRLGQR